MTDTDPKHEDGAILRHLRQAFRHVDGAIHSYLGLLEAKGMRLVKVLVIYLAIGLGLTTVSIAGLFFILYGIARWLEQGIGMTEGLGFLCVGILMVCAVLGGILILRRKKGGPQ